MTESNASSERPRTFVVDTNVLLFDASALLAFAEHDVVIPLTVIEEMDRFKKQIDETGRNARETSRFLDDLRGKGSLKEGVALPGGGFLRVDYSVYDPALPIDWGPDNNDNRIIRSVLRLHRDLGGNVCLITRDTNMRLKCDALGVCAEDYQNAHVQISDEVYVGICERVVAPGVIDELYTHGEVAVESNGLHPQEFVILSDGGGKSAMARVNATCERMKLVARHKEGCWGIFARNKEQLFAMDLLLDPEIKLVTLNGVAGTGKTILAIACALRQVADEGTYRKVLVSRPIFPLGRDIGYLPGDVEDKLNPWMKPIFDNLDYLMSTKSDRRMGRGEPTYQYLMDQKIIEVEALTYIRGRSITEQYLIIDEAQNLTPHEVKTVLTRAGEGTKVVMTGDPYQIDNPYVDALSNGLVYAVERFKNAAIAGHITLRKGERSELAELATQLL